MTDDRTDQRVHTMVGVLPFPRTPGKAASPPVLPVFPASDDELSDLIHNALQRPEDLVQLMCSDRHMVAVLERTQRLEDDHDTLVERHARARELLASAAAEIKHLQAERDAYRRAYEAERDAKQRFAAAAATEHDRLVAEQQYTQKLLAYSETMRQDADRARRANQEISRHLADALSELAARDRTTLVNEGTRSEVPPEDVNAFGDGDFEPTMLFPRGTDPMNRVADIDTLIEDVPEGGS